MEIRSGETGETGAMPALGVRRFGAFNRLGMWTLYQKEVQRFTKIALQTVLAPVVTAFLFFVVFTLALGRAKSEVNGIPFSAFLAPGLIMMATLQNAFTNTSSSLLGSKIQGNYVDFLMPPLAPGELGLCFAAGGITRGLAVALATWIAMSPFTDLSPAHLWAVVFFALGAAAMLSMIGILAGIWAEKFDHMATVTNFVIAPMAFLSGTFYSIHVLPEPWTTVSQFNPFFYLIDGFRYGFTGVADGDLRVGVALTLGINAVLWGAVLYVLRKGYRLKA